MPATRSKVGDASFNDDKGPDPAARNFNRPFAFEDRRERRSSNLHKGSGSRRLHDTPNGSEQGTSLLSCLVTLVEVLAGDVGNGKISRGMARWKEHYMRMAISGTVRASPAALNRRLPFTESRRQMGAEARFSAFLPIVGRQPSPRFTRNIAPL